MRMSSHGCVRILLLESIGRIDSRFAYWIEPQSLSLFAYNKAVGHTFGRNSLSIWHSVFPSIKSASFPVGYLRSATVLTLSGGVHAMTFATGPLPSWSLAIVQIASLAVLVRVVGDAKSLKQAAIRGWWFGAVSFGVGLYWLFISMNHYGGLSATLAAAGVIALSAFLALFTGIACAIFSWLRPPSLRTAPLMGALAWSGAWASMEWLRAVAFSGFPWLNIGYAHVDSPLAGWATVLGVHGTALSAAFVAAALAALCSSPTSLRRPAIFTLSALVVVVGVGELLTHVEWASAEGKPLNIRLVQGNIKQSQKFDPALLELGIARHLQLATKPPLPDEPVPDLIVLPETVLPVFQDQLEAHVWKAWRDVAERQHSTIAMGAPLRIAQPSGEFRYTNSAIGFDASTPVQQLIEGTMPQRYDKRHLVPWGEYVPPGFEWFVQMLDMPMGEFDRGPIRQTPFTVGEQQLAFNICYEDVFGPEILPALLTSSGSDEGASVIVNISNLGWFGDTWALRQHLQIGRLRSIETARPMVTSTNTGITAAIDPHGRVLAALPPHRSGVLPVTVQGMTGLTPYTRFGDIPALILVAVFLTIAARCRYSRRLSNRRHSNAPESCYRSNGGI